MIQGKIRLKTPFTFQSLFHKKSYVRLKPHLNINCPNGILFNGIAQKNQYNKFLGIMNIHVYRGKITKTSEILYTWDGKLLYKGRVPTFTDILLTIDGNVPIPVLLATI